ncbi:MAG TPA: hypothetical protein VMD92_15130 [Acidobacteriaceae bacterium]|nr:hypothetical protein [Acidobacteriaceae bacterium]
MGFPDKEVERMSRVTARFIYWSPRILSVAFAIFLSLFALEAFNEVHGFGRILLAILIDLVPALVIVAVLIAAWRWEWIGAGLFFLAAVYYAWSWTGPPRHVHWTPIAGISGPLLVMAALFLMSWIERSNVRLAR